MQIKLAKPLSGARAQQLYGSNQKNSDNMKRASSDPGTPGAKRYRIPVKSPSNALTHPERRGEDLSLEAQGLRVAQSFSITIMLQAELGKMVENLLNPEELTVEIGRNKVQNPCHQRCLKDLPSSQTSGDDQKARESKRSRFKIQIL